MNQSKPIESIHRHRIEKGEYLFIVRRTGATFFTLNTYDEVKHAKRALDDYCEKNGLTELQDFINAKRKEVIDKKEAKKKQVAERRNRERLAVEAMSETCRRSKRIASQPKTMAEKTSTSQAPLNSDSLLAPVDPTVAAATDVSSSSSNSNDGEGVTVNFHWRTDFPTNLQDLCIKDRARIHLGQLTRLPAAVTIDAIIDKYEKSLGLNSDAPGTSDGAEMAELQLKTVNGMKHSFNKTLHLQLLYPAEREQYRVASQDQDFSASANYGIVHLLRAFTQLPETIKRAKMQSSSVEGLVANSKLFLEFLSQNLESFGVEYYKPTEEKKEAAERPNRKRAAEKPMPETSRKSSRIAAQSKPKMAKMTPISPTPLNSEVVGSSTQGQSTSLTIGQLFGESWKKHGYVPTIYLLGVDPKAPESDAVVLTEEKENESVMSREK